MDQSTPRAATSKADAEGQQGLYTDNDGVGAVKGKVAARQGFRDRPVAVVLAVSLFLIVAAFVAIYFTFAGSTPTR